MAKRKILFLDIDGVLNCKNSGTFYNIESPEKYGIDERLWRNLEKFLGKFPDVKIVIHSGWIKHKDDPNYAWNLGHPELGVKIKSHLQEVIDRLGDRYLDCVPYIKGKSKFYRIQKWLVDNGILDNASCPCLVVDDDHSEYSRLLDLEKYCNVYVKFTNTETGLNSVVLADMIEIGEVIYR